MHIRDDFFSLWSIFLFFSAGVCISELISFGCICNKVSDSSDSNQRLQNKITFTPRIPFSQIIVNINIVYKYKSILRDNVVKNGMWHPRWYDDVINKVEKVKSDTCKLVKS